MLMAILNKIPLFNPKRSGKKSRGNIKIVDNPPKTDWNEPSTLMGKLPFSPTLEQDMLPDLVSQYVFQQAELRDNASPEYSAVAVLVSAAALLGGSVTISPKRRYKEWKLKPILWGMIVGSPSRMKSPSLLVGLSLFSYVIKTIIEPNNKQLERHYNAESKANKAKADRLEKLAQKNVDEGNDEAAKQVFMQLEQLEPEMPKYRRPLINDCTIEALIKRIHTNPLGVLMYRDELYGWISSLDRQDKAQDRSFCNEAFNGSGHYEVERVSRGNLILENPTLFVLGNIQPDRLKKLISGRAEGESNDGLFERFQLMVYPEGMIKQYVDTYPDNALKKQMQAIFIKLAYLGTPERYSEPLHFDFAPSAQELWDKWAIALIEREIASNDDDQAILGKHGALVAKLALVFHLLYEAEKCTAHDDFKPCQEVSSQALSLAIRWSDFLYQHNLRVRSIGSKSSAVSQSAELLKSKLSLLPTEFAARDVSRKCWTGLKTPENISEATEILIQHGYLRKSTVPGQNGKMTTRYLIHPSYRGTVS